MRTPIVAGLARVFAVLVTAAPARAVQVTTGSGSGLAGQTVDIPISVPNVTGLGIRSLQFDLSYNSAIVTATDVIEAGGLVGAAGWNDASFDVDIVSGATRRIRVATAGANPLSGSGAMLFVRFVISPTQLASTSTGLTLSALDFNEGTPVDTTSNGLITVNPTPIITVTPNVATVIRGNTQAFAVGGSVTNPVSWFTTNPAIATVSGSGLMTGVAPGFVRVYAVDNAGRRDTTDSDIEVRGMGLTAGTTSVFANNTVDVPITVTSLTGLGIRSGQVTLNFTAGRATALSVQTPPGTLLNGWGTVGFDANIDDCTVDFAGTTDLNGSGVLCYVRFQGGPTATTTSLVVAQALFNEVLPAVTTNGSLTITGLPVLNVSPNSVTLLAGQTQQFTVSGTVTPPVTWSVIDPTLGTISPTGLFTAVKGGVTQVKVVDNVGASGITSSVTIYDFKATLGTVTCPPGATVMVPLESDRLLGGLGIYAMQYAVTFPSTNVTAVNSTASGLVGAWSPNVLTRLPSAGRVEVTAAGSAAFANNGTTVHGLLFTVSPTAPNNTSIPLTLVNVLCNEGAPIPQIVNGLILVRTTTDAPAPGALAFALAPPEPNPVRGPSRLEFSVPDGRAGVRLAVYGTDGRRVRMLHDGPLGDGAQSVAWDVADERGQRVPAGLYFVRLEWNGRSLSRKLAVVP